MGSAAVTVEDNCPSCAQLHRDFVELRMEIRAEAPAILLPSESAPRCERQMETDPLPA